MPESEAPPADKKKPFANLAKVLLGAGLPFIATAIGGPMGGVVATSITQALGMGAAPASEDKISETLAAASPDALVTLRRIEADLATAQLTAFSAEAREVSARWKADTGSDSWLARNVRPLSLAVMMLGYLIYVYVASFILVGQQAATAVMFGSQLQMVLFAIVGAYFGSRGFEKIASIKSGGAA